MQQFFDNPKKQLVRLGTGFALGTSAMMTTQVNGDFAAFVGGVGLLESCRQAKDDGSIACALGFAFGLAYNYSYSYAVTCTPNSNTVVAAP